MISRKKKKDLASAENRTQSHCLEGSDVFHYTTEACLVNSSQNGYIRFSKNSDEILYFREGRKVLWFWFTMFRHITLNFSAKCVLTIPRFSSSISNVEDFIQFSTEGQPIQYWRSTVPVLKILIFDHNCYSIKLRLKSFLEDFTQRRVKNEEKFLRLCY